MTMTFYKYQGTGNDFIIVDNRDLSIDKNDTKRIAELCHRRFGIGADGFILLENDETSDFKMVYYNSDGNQSTMCGNGGRCIVAFAKFLGVIKDETEFVAIDGLHKAKVDNAIVHLQMQDVSTIEIFDNHTFLNTGSPHHVEMVSDIKNYNVPYGCIPNYEIAENFSDIQFSLMFFHLFHILHLDHKGPYFDYLDQ